MERDLSRLTAGSLIGIISFLIGVLLILVLLFRPGWRDYLSKLIGSCFIISLSLISGNWFVYSMAIFIIATLVTDLKFLEKMMALLWGRKEYWDYLIHTLTPDEVKEELKKEAKFDKVPPAQIDSYISRSITFEERAINLLFHPEAGIFKKGKIIKNPELSDISGQRHIVDALIESGNRVYLVEAKSSRQKQALVNSLENLRAFESLFHQINARVIGKNVRTRLLLIAPTDVHSEHFLEKDIPVLKVNKDFSSFSNQRAILNWLHKS